MPGFFGKGGSGRAGDIARRLREREAGKGEGVRLPFGRPGRLVVVMVLMLAVGMLLLRRVGMGPPSTDLRRANVARENMAVLRTALDRFAGDCGQYPFPSDGLASLIHDPDVAGWSGPYIFALKADPWGRQFRYGVEEGRFLLHSTGADGVDGTDDDVRLVWRAGEAVKAVEGVYPADIR